MNRLLLIFCFILIFLLDVLSAMLAAQDTPDSEEADLTPRWFQRPVDIWGRGLEYETKDLSEDNRFDVPLPGSVLIQETIWAEPIKLPDGRYTLYVPPKLVLQFLKSPTKESARAYLAWQEERARKMKKAIRLLALVKEELVEKNKEPDIAQKGRAFEVIYFHSDT